MGGCFSDVRGGKQAVGGAPSNINGGINEAVDLFVKSQRAVQLFTPVLELSFSASNLHDRDYTSKSDPMVVVYAEHRDDQLEELGRTEVVLNDLNPSWIEKVRMAYLFESVQSLVFRVYDVDTKFGNINVKALDLNNQDFLGEGKCVLSEIVTKQCRSLTLNLHYSSYGTLRGRTDFGTLTVHAEETSASKSVFEIVFRCSHLENKDLFSKSDPFLRISRMVEKGVCVPICKTEVVDNNLNPTWNSLCLSMQQIGSKDDPLIIECFDFNSNGKHVLIGKLQKSVAELENLYKEKNSINFVIPSSRHGREKLSKGLLFVDHFCEKEQFSFIDYISSGFELNFMVAVDFTLSNGDPRETNSLHYIHPSRMLNSYQEAIKQVGEVVQFYDTDKRFPAWGFGAQLKGGTKVTHCFNMDGAPNGSEVQGVEGIMSAYSSALHNVSLSGPTLFGDVINRAADMASQSLLNHSNKYFVLLIITDGILNDLQKTIDALVRASHLPLSVMIVGVGTADFRNMDILDNDNGPPLRSSTGCLAARDIVQFVPLREVNRKGIPVVQSLLEELPRQFLSYMRTKGIKPLAPSPWERILS